MRIALEECRKPKERLKRPEYGKGGLQGPPTTAVRTKTDEPLVVKLARTPFLERSDIPSVFIEVKILER